MPRWRVLVPRDDPRRRQPSITKAYDLMGWKPRVALNKGLRTTIDYFILKIASEDAESSRPAASLRLQGTRSSARRRTAVGQGTAMQ